MVISNKETCFLVIAVAVFSLSTFAAESQTPAGIPRPESQPTLKVNNHSPATFVEAQKKVEAEHLQPPQLHVPTAADFAIEKARTAYRTAQLSLSQANLQCEANLHTQELQTKLQQAYADLVAQLKCATGTQMQQDTLACSAAAPPVMPVPEVKK